MFEIFAVGTAENFCHRSIIQRLKYIFHQNSFAQINEPNSKLRTYKHLKSQIGFEDYITFIPNEKERISFTKFRLSNHQEKGRYMNLARE